MTPEKQQDIIAKVCGWVEFQEEEYPHRMLWRKGDIGSQIFDEPDDYLNDLNAMREALQTLDNMSGFNLVEDLCKVRGGWENNTYFDLFVRSTASEWAKAFLKTTGRWK